MNRRRGRRSTRRDGEELRAEIHAARLKWESMSLEERIEAGRRDWHSTPDLRKWPGLPFAAWGNSGWLLSR
jgi:hypothetical protein